MIRNAPELGTTLGTNPVEFLLDQLIRPPQPPLRGAAAPPPSAQRAEAGTGPARRLPGEPANRLSPNRTEPQSPEPAQR
jgi:hypothetical protein